ncbi:penicillin-binding protein activator [Cellvibrio zantedeschiae]|uniref:Penicillin-binding protein activator n=1 Tax=Cellvibrio zantedeschiae TaxID=1237077 RepID=A0ABQ3AN96_9GAMM|nr:penicillin-binding protein activator [Cellvibrio zantedeschiae]GGY62637.1 penicillin-binding protein activator [Cellvibrio zantedeschiae]
MLNRPTHCVFISLLALAISSCGGDARVKPNEPASTVKSDAAAATKTSTATQDPQTLITLAQQKKSPERETLILQAAEIYLAQNKLDKARNLIGELGTNQSSDSVFVKSSQLSADLALKDGNADRARRILTNTRLEQQLKALEPAQEAALRELRAQAFERNGQLHESIAERINASALLTDQQAANINQDVLWQTLMNIPLNELQANAMKGSGGITQGWYSLAALSKNNTQDISAQLASLTQWQKQWRTHPAASNLPKDLRALQGINTSQPKKIALLLPLQGRLTEAGETVSDGFFAAYYQHIGTTNLPSVRKYDSSKDSIAAYQQAVNDGADFIIGPIDKDNVNAISRLTSLQVPLLSLNYPDQQPAQPLANFYQFGLAVEDEARQVARQGIQDGYKRALIVSTAQEISERSAQAFAAEWQKLGGTLVGKSNFASQDKFSESFRHLMLLDESQARATLLQQQLGTKLEFQPRRRADVNMIFMAVTPDQGRQIKPTLVFQYANSIPVYATSSIYSGDADAIKNEDLNGVIFNTLPWVFDSNNPTKQTIAQNTRVAAVYGRLHALGADAFHLYSRLAQLKQAPQMRIYGATGSLQLLPDGRIEREQMWARFNEGLAEPLATVVDTSNQEASE